MKKLFSFGCSNTFGVALDDCWNFEKKKAGDHPSKFAWPQIVADKLKLTNINLSKPGASNKEITKIILDNLNLISKDDIVIVLWSYTTRWCMIHSNGSVENLAHWVKSHNAVVWTKDLYDQYDRDFENKIFIDYVYLLLKEKNIKVYFFASNKELNDRILFNNAVFLNTAFDFARSDYPKALDDNHAGKEGNLAFAEEVYKEIKKDTT